MPDPTTHTTIATAVAASSASVTAGTFLGVEYSIFGVALLAAAISHIWLSRMKFSQMLAGILGSFVLGVFLAAVGTDVVVHTAEKAIPFLDLKSLETDQTSAKLFIAFFVAFLAQKGVPYLFDKFDKNGDPS